jgi:GT2 family glycosyltransferase
MLAALTWILLVVNAAGAAVWAIVAWHVARILHDRPTVRRGLELALPHPPRVSVVVPVHNEERVIERCAGALRGQRYDDLEIVFVLDRCTDRTREILTAHARGDDRIALIENDACPEGWAGKCHAARLGAERATGAYLLFCDADCFFDPDLVRAAVALAEAHDLALLSLLSTLTATHRFERVIQPVATTNLVRLFPIERVDRAHPPRPFANGQFMLFRRGAYESIGGHAAVKADLLEDIAFARAVRAAGKRGGVFLADGMLVVSMYESFAAFKAGWKRIFVEACRRKTRRLRENAWRILGVGVVVPAAQLLSLALGAVQIGAGAPVLGGALLGAAAVVWILQIPSLVAAYGLCGAPRSAVLLYPIGAWVVGRIMLDAARDLVERRPIRWGGREYILAPRD